jgi:protoheme IX farnesyltransferase
MREHLDIFREFGKVRISALATITMVAGYVLARGGASWELAPVTLGVFLLACGSSALNQIQERDIDSLMLRTQGRPLPSRRVSLSYAIGMAVINIVLGCLVVLWSSNVDAMVLGLITVGWYNGVYTPLKRVTAFAAVPGGVVGAIPPVIGWVAAGGSAYDPRILAVAFFFFMWQVPHFWLLLLFSAGEDYERAGLPSMTRFFSMTQIARITFAWILGTAAACVVIPLFGVIDSGWINLGLFVSGLWLVAGSARIMRADEGLAPFKLAFKHVNLFAIVVIAMLSLDGILR